MEDIYLSFTISTIIAILFILVIITVIKKSERDKLKRIQVFLENSLKDNKRMPDVRQNTLDNINDDLCPECKSVLNPDDMYCGNCGMKI